MNFKELLKKEFIIYDGGMGTMLQKRGLKMGDNPNVLSITHPQTIVDVNTNCEKIDCNFTQFVLLFNQI